MLAEKLERSASSSGGAERRAVEKSDAEWRAALSEEEYKVIRGKGTDVAFEGEYDHFKPSPDGHFACRACKAPLYSAAAKFESGSAHAATGVTSPSTHP